MLAGPASAERIYGVFTGNNVVVTFDTTNTGTLISNHPLSGPPPATISDVILGLAVQPETGQLYGISGTGIYTIDPATGLKVRVAPSPLTLPFEYLAGASFQPGTDNLFFTSAETRSLREVNLDTGVTRNLGPLVFAPTDTNAGINTFVEALTWGTPTGGTTPVLYGIDATAGLVAINSSNGLKTTVGPIPAFAGSGSGAGFTYSDLTGTAYVNFPKPNSNRTVDQFLYTIDLRTGGTALVGAVDHFSLGVLLIAAANVQAVPEPGTLLLFASATALLLISRRRTWQ